MRSFTQCDGMQAELRIEAIKLGAEGGAPAPLQNATRPARILDHLGNHPPESDGANHETEHEFEDELRVDQLHQKSWSSWAEWESILVEAYDAELLMLAALEEFHREAPGSRRRGSSARADCDRFRPGRTTHQLW